MKLDPIYVHEDQWRRYTADDSGLGAKVRNRTTWRIAAQVDNQVLEGLIPETLRTDLGGS